MPSANGGWLVAGRKDCRPGGAGEWGGVGGYKDFAPAGAANRRDGQRVENSPAIYGWGNRPSN